MRTESWDLTSKLLFQIFVMPAPKAKDRMALLRKLIFNIVKHCCYVVVVFRVVVLESKMASEAENSESLSNLCILTGHESTL